MVHCGTLGRVCRTGQSFRCGSLSYSLNDHHSATACRENLDVYRRHVKEDKEMVSIVKHAVAVWLASPNKNRNYQAKINKALSFQCRQ